jgi:predicted  nucleic acid-binding Zn-ribbon protein
MENHKERAEELEQEADKLEDEGDRVEQDIDEARGDWESKQDSSDVPGAVPDEDEEEE